MDPASDGLDELALLDATEDGPPSASPKLYTLKPEALKPGADSFASDHPESQKPQKPHGRS